jgi:hypothetical protein
VEIGNDGKQLLVLPERIQEIRDLLAKTHSIELADNSESLEAMFKTKQFAIEIFDLK